MSKKSKKKNKYFNTKSKKDKKKSKKSYYEKPKFKTVKPSLEKKEVKENKKILLAPIDIPKTFRQNRTKCNHAGDLITVEEFKAMTPNYGAYTPMLDTMIAVFGEENLAICRSCYDVVVRGDMINNDRISEALAVLYGAANAVVSRKRMKNDEIKDLNKLKSDLQDWHGVMDAVADLWKKDLMGDTGSNDTAIDPSALNNVDGVTTL